MKLIKAGLLIGLGYLIGSGAAYFMFYWAVDVLFEALGG